MLHRWYMEIVTYEFLSQIISKYLLRCFLFANSILRPWFELIWYSWWQQFSPFLYFRYQDGFSFLSILQTFNIWGSECVWKWLSATFFLFNQLSTLCNRHVQNLRQLFEEWSEVWQTSNTIDLRNLVWISSWINFKLRIWSVRVPTVKCIVQIRIGLILSSIPRYLSISNHTHSS